MAFSLTSASAVPACRSARTQRIVARAEKSTEGTASEFDSEKFFKDLKEQWDAVEDKTSIAVYGAGALTLLWLSSTLVGAINSVPVVPKLMELVGLGYTAWFVYRYLLFKDSRKELISDVEELKKKISGDSP